MQRGVAVNILVFVLVDVFNYVLQVKQHVAYIIIYRQDLRFRILLYIGTKGDHCLGKVTSNHVCCQSDTR